ncbi:Retrovirus-related pol polyprotein from transposon re1 [Thalictrum thalictroides]|uniref:Retrovirus-related pol polyprotein from transposon re1 n=1 Tax=Thalictrum thalictroides TaxID=46969 RepID=A0A7J6W7M7_THATH|nr:Retrovirus-related pol polyprotein from transposon re1 [Thalictrum thalictroides]
MTVHDPSDTLLWHKRLGHPSVDRLNKISSIKSDVSSFHSHCDVCIRAKQTRILFQSSKTRSNEPFDLIHIDIWGGYQTTSHTGAHYFLTVVDDYSRCTWVYLMRFKSEACTLLQNFCQMVKTQFNHPVRIIRSDNGAEFLSSSMKLFYQNNGILHQRTCVDTPQQNGVAERKHRHLLEVARALRF